MGLVSAQTDYVPCDIATFKVDLSRPGLKSRYNKLVAFVFVKHLLEKVLEPPILDADQQTKDRFLAMFWSHLTYLQTQYRARNITQQEIKELHRKEARYQRKRTVCCLLFHRRRDTIKSRPELLPHLPFMDSLGVDGTSSDEEEHIIRDDGATVVRYKIIVPWWRAKEVERFLQKIDMVYFMVKEAQNRGGSILRQRMRPSETSQSEVNVAVRRLPKNAYNDAWLGTMNPLLRDIRAQPREEVYSFDIDAELNRQAICTIGGLGLTRLITRTLMHWFSLKFGRQWEAEES
ncbi:hypothetical protein ARMGADRAFT_939041 [Armillaria gallica]|uniref:Uncharacterized protein n=1 Tax=Armillaria gallica TaxID=47427 RepID=A0A2H3D7G5_ARMGA|nr:hypothetical protein ARMGADRAFT_939041 [Armillaria gallica]